MNIEPLVARFVEQHANDLRFVPRLQRKRGTGWLRRVGDRWVPHFPWSEIYAIVRPTQHHRALLDAIERAARSHPSFVARLDQLVSPDDPLFIEAVRQTFHREPKPRDIERAMLGARLTDSVLLRYQTLVEGGWR